VSTAFGQSAVVSADQFTYSSAPVVPVVSAVSPSSGSTAGGTSVTITGSGFAGATAVTFGGSAGTNVVVLSDTSITVTSPAHAVAVTNVRVTAPAGQSAVVSADQFTYSSAPVGPVVSSVSPNTGPTSGETLVTITGSGFTDATTVVFGGVAAPSFAVRSDSKIVAVSPTHAAGTANVQVTAPSGQSAVVSADQFAYGVVPVVSGVSPASGSTAGGTLVTITGTGFTSSSSVSFGGVAAQSVTFVSGTTLSALSPPHAAGTTNVRVSTAFGQSAIADPADEFSYQLAVPTVTKLAPKSGPVAGGTSVTITGTGFTPDATVSFGNGDPATSVTYVSATELIVVSPPHAATSGDVNVTVTTGSGSSAVVTADQYKYV
jgi:hypothetical protein